MPHLIPIAPLVAVEAGQYLHMLPATASRMLTRVEMVHRCQCCQSWIRYVERSKTAAPEAVRVFTE